MVRSKLGARQTETVLATSKRQIPYLRLEVFGSHRSGGHDRSTDYSVGLGLWAGGATSLPIPLQFLSHHQPPMDSRGKGRWCAILRDIMRRAIGPCETVHTAGDSGGTIFGELANSPFNRLGGESRPILLGKEFSPRGGTPMPRIGLTSRGTSAVAASC